MTAPHRSAAAGVARSIAAPYPPPVRDYGTAWARVATAPADGPKSRGKVRTSLLCSCIFLPWLMFCVISAAQCFWLRYSAPGAVHLVLVICAVAVLAVVHRAVRSGGDDAEWLWFLAALLLAAFAAGIEVGDMNYISNLQPYYDSLNLQYYADVDPSKFRGNQLMDAGRVLFANGSALDLGKAMGFKNFDWYCVAPIAQAGVANATQDFWAVGVNCCGSEGKSFTCGEFSNPKAKSGLRLMRDDQRPFFRLAVQQAEALHKLKAPHPLFFHWMEEPQNEVASYRDDGVKCYNIGMFLSLAINLFLVVVAVPIFLAKT